MLSPTLRWHGNGESSSSRLSSCDIADAKNSFVFNVNETCSSLVNSYLHILPVMGSYPPMPVSQASLTEMEVGCRKTTELIEMPSLAYSMNLSQRWRSILDSFVR